jgi:hypothetical protein
VIEILPNTPPLEKRLIALESLEKYLRALLQNNEENKKCSKSIFEHQVTLRYFIKGDLVLSYDITHDTLGLEKFESLWQGPYVIRHYLTKGAYIMAYLEWANLKDPVNKLYLNKFYP